MKPINQPGQIRVLAVMLAASLALAACQSKNAGIGPADDLATGSIGKAELKAASEAATRWEANPGNAALAIAYSDRLESLGQTERQIEVLRRASQLSPKDTALKVRLGKKLAVAGRADEATEVLEATTEDGRGGDWKTYSALGSSYDQQSRHKEARVQYERALALKPNDPGVLNNMGMSHALEGDLPKAEATLRKAMGFPSGLKMQRLRQNLALVVGLQGRYDEARDIASKDQPPQEVEANLAYLKSMLAQPNTWQQLQNNG